MKRLGLRPRRGILLYGPPGCAKTTLVRAMATSSKAGFITADTASIYSPLLGESERKMRELFKLARANQPCILFLDEIDGIVARRSFGAQDHGNGVEGRLLSTLLNEMDGINSQGEVVLVAATNRPDMLDAALTRPGRFDHQFYIPPPDAKGIEAILGIFTRSMPLDPNLDLREFGPRLIGYTGADIKNICREASMSALRRDCRSSVVTKSDILDAIRMRKSSLHSQQRE